jgi:hypothetical protein
MKVAVIPGKKESFLAEHIRNIHGTALCDGSLKDVEALVAWEPDLIIFDKPNCDELSHILKQKFCVIDSSRVMASNATDLVIMRLFFASGITVPDTFHYFQDKASAFSYVTDYPGIYHIKNNDCKSIFQRAENEEETLELLLLGDFPDGILMKQYIEGTKVSIGGWFNGSEFMFPLFANAGSGWFCVDNDDDKLFKAGLKKFIHLLSAFKHVGFCGINHVISHETKRAVAIGLTDSRKVMPFFLSHFKGDVAEWLVSLSKKQTKNVTCAMIEPKISDVMKLSGEEHNIVAADPVPYNITIRRGSPFNIQFELYLGAVAYPDTPITEVLLTVKTPDLKQTLFTMTKTAGHFSVVTIATKHTITGTAIGTETRLISSNHKLGVFDIAVVNANTAQTPFVPIAGKVTINEGVSV